MYKIKLLGLRAESLVVRHLGMEHYRSSLRLDFENVYL